MSDPIPDDDLEALFARQRGADHERSPAFHAMRARSIKDRVEACAPKPLLWRWALPAGATLALAAAALLAIHHAKTPVTPTRDALARQLEAIDAALQRSATAERELTAWQSPTDFLLHPTQNENRP